MKRSGRPLAIFFSFVLIITLMTALLILIHTNHRLENLQWQMLYTSSDCCVGNLDREQVEKLIAGFSFEWYTVEQQEYTEYSRNSHIFSLIRGDDAHITLTSRLEEGELPEAENEIAAERWTLLNLGIEPECGQEFTVHNNTVDKKQTFRLVGILSDVASNKKYGVKYLYAPIRKTEKAKYNVYIRFADGSGKKNAGREGKRKLFSFLQTTDGFAPDYEKQAAEIQKLLDIPKKQVKGCPGREDMEELQKIDIVMISILLLIGAVIFYGVYRIAQIARKKEYGIFRAVGMTRGQMRCMVLLELYQAFFASVPIGVIVGVVVALSVSWMSGDWKQDIYLNNTSISFTAVIPVVQIAVGIILFALIVSLIGTWAGQSVGKQPVSVLLSGENGKEKVGGGFPIQEKYGRNRTLFCLGSRYLLKDKKTSLFVILTICVGTVLFIGLFYQAESAWLFRKDTKEMNYLNGQYEMGMLGMDSITDGISQENMEAIQALDSVSSVKSMAGLPIRVIDQKEVRRNDTYYEDMNERCLKYNDYPFMGNDGKDNVYHSILYGYNQNALKELKKYVIEGDFPVDGLKDDEIIVCVLRMDDTKENDFPGSYREGTPLMDYHAGDSIQMKYRSDFNTSPMVYKKLEDTDAPYIYRTYRIAAIVSFSYMFDCNRTIFPLLITSEEQLKAINPDYHIQHLYIDGSPSLSDAQQSRLEKQLIRIGNQSQNVSTRSMVKDIQKNEMLFLRQMVYVSSIAAVAFVLILINIENNLRYRMQVRTREICMYRAIGMSVSMIRKMMVWENGMLALLGILCGYVVANPVLRYLYRQSGRKAFGHPYHFQYGAFFLIALLVILLCMFLSLQLSGTWKTKKISSVLA